MRGAWGGKARGKRQGVRRMNTQHLQPFTLLLAVEPSPLTLAPCAHQACTLHVVWPMCVDYNSCPEPGRVAGLRERLWPMRVVACMCCCLHVCGVCVLLHVYVLSPACVWPKRVVACVCVADCMSVAYACCCMCVLLHVCGLTLTSVALSLPSHCPLHVSSRRRLLLVAAGRRGFCVAAEGMGWDG